MQIELEYANFGWKKEERHEAHGQKREVAVQTVWKQLEENEWLCVDLVRMEAGFNRTSVHVEGAWIKRDLQPNGGWRSATQLVDFHTAIRLVEDQRVRNTHHPIPPKVADNAAARYIASKAYAVPGRK
jgi:hypothetical protein